jgi:hypothetical protein
MSVESYFRTHFRLDMSVIPLLANHFHGSYQTVKYLEGARSWISVVLSFDKVSPTSL